MAGGNLCISKVSATVLRSVLYKKCLQSQVAGERRRVQSGQEPLRRPVVEAAQRHHVARFLIVTDDNWRPVCAEFASPGRTSSA